MPFRSLEQGAAAIQQGKFIEGARLIRIALKSDQIQGELRATGFLWLAETTADTQQKLDYYTKAVEADPDNTEAQHRIAEMMAAGLPSPPSGAEAWQVGGSLYIPTQTGDSGTGPQPNPHSVLPAVGVLGGPNGPGTGFFVTQDGLLVTTRYVVGGQDQMRLLLGQGQSIVGQVVRAFPTLDLALIHTGLPINSLPTMVAGASKLPPGTPLFVRFHNGRQLTGTHRGTRSRIPPEWFPTTIDQSYDAGGNPIFDSQNHLVGMLTRNCSRTSDYVFGLYIDVVFRCVERYLHEIRTGEPTVYCPVCGNLSRVGASGGFYCEKCGATLPLSLDVTRRPLPQMTALYDENQHHPCPKCRSRVGSYADKCLRCGTVISR